MADTTFVDGVTQIDAEWLNFVNDLVYGSNAILARLADSSASNGDAMVGVKKTFADAVATTQHEVNDRVLDGFDFMSPEEIADVKAGTALLDVSDAVEAAFTRVFAGSRKLTFQPGTYLLSRLLDFSALAAVYGVTIIAHGAVFKNTTTGVLKLPQLVLSEFGGLQFIGSDSDLAVNRNAASAVWFPNQLTLTRLHNLRIKYFSKGIELPGGLFNTIEHCFTSYCAHHLYIGGGAFVNNLLTIQENTFNVSENGTDRANGYTLTTDVAVYVNDSTGLTLKNNAVEFPQAYGFQLSNIKSATIETNYFEHGYNGVDIDIASSFTRYYTLTNNFHFAGSGNGGTPGGHKPINIATSALPYATFTGATVTGFDAANILYNYNDAFVTKRITLQDDNILVDSNLSNVDVEQARLYSREFALAAGATVAAFTVDTDPEARVFLRVLIGHARDTTGANHAMAECFLILTNEADVMTTSQQANTQIGTPCTLTLSDAVGVVTITINNGTANNVQGTVLLEATYTRAPATVAALI